MKIINNWQTRQKNIERKRDFLWHLFVIITPSDVVVLQRSVSTSTYIASNGTLNLEWLQKLSALYFCLISSSDLLFVVLLLLIRLLFFLNHEHELFLLSSTLTLLITINPLRRLMIFHTAHGSHFPQNWKENKSMEVTLKVWNCFSLFKSDRGSSFGEQRGLF